MLAYHILPFYDCNFVSTLVKHVYRDSVHPDLFLLKNLKVLQKIYRQISSESTLGKVIFRSLFYLRRHVPVVKTKISSFIDSICIFKKSFWTIPIFSNGGPTFVYTHCRLKLHIGHSISSIQIRCTR